MRTIQVSPDVFQAIWSARKPGEDDEDPILRRLLKLPPAPKLDRDLKVQLGFHDPRYGVEIPQGFEIFRTFRGERVSAQAIQGFWMRNGIGYPTLNELNRSLGGGAENAWAAWRYRDDKGRVRPLSDLRSEEKIIRRGG